MSGWLNSAPALSSCVRTSPSRHGSVSSDTLANSKGCHRSYTYDTDQSGRARVAAQVTLADEARRQRPDFETYRTDLLMAVRRPEEGCRRTLAALARPTLAGLREDLDRAARAVGEPGRG